MATLSPTRPATEQQAETGEPDLEAAPDRPWVCIVWDDPINLMNYVTHVLMTVFGYPKAKAESLMLDVHERGKAVVSAGTRERMELDAARLHGYGLWATIEHDQ
jgi:ATP-dependent Clp protease adaptor protein ClpS